MFDFDFTEDRGKPATQSESAELEYGSPGASTPLSGTTRTQRNIITACLRL
jgi:hypothetical protein